MKYFLYILIILLLHNCTLFENDAVNFDIVKLDRAVLLGTSNEILPSKITDMWVYADEQFLGIYPLPNFIPIPNVGTPVKLSLRGGVKPNGQSESSEEYPFFMPFDTTIILNSGDTAAVFPKFKYKSECKFDIIEDFESGNIFTVGIGTSVQKPCLSRVSNKGVNNSTAGFIGLNPDQKSCEMTHFNLFSNQNNQFGKVYLEMDYKSNEKFFVGTILQVKNQLIKSYDIIIIESDDWNRIYIDFTNKISRLDVESYQIALSALLNENRNNQAEIYFDNIRLVHF